MIARTRRGLKKAGKSVDPTVENEASAKESS